MSCLQLDIWDEAESELLGAKEWYNGERPGLGDQLFLEVQKTLHSIQQSPLRFPVVQGELRRAVVSRFHFSVIYRLRQNVIEIIAILHQARNPRRWEKRER